MNLKSYTSADETETSGSQGLSLRPSTVVVSCFRVTLSAATLFVILPLLQLTVIGLLDRLGVSPLFSFLALNVVLIAIIAPVTLRPFLKGQPSAAASRIQNANKAISMVSHETIASRRLCKTLIIRRLNLDQSSSSQPTSQTRYERSASDAISVHDWFSGS
jgi:uncharacterized protein (UPF0333 family)